MPSRASLGTKWNTDLQVGNVDYGTMRFVDRVVDIYKLGEDVRVMLKRCADPLATDEPYEALELKTLSASAAPIASVHEGAIAPAARAAASSASSRRSIQTERSSDSEIAAELYLSINTVSPHTPPSSPRSASPHRAAATTFARFEQGLLETTA